MDVQPGTTLSSSGILLPFLSSSSSSRHCVGKGIVSAEDTRTSNHKKNCNQKCAQRPEDVPSSARCCIPVAKLLFFYFSYSEATLKQKKKGQFKASLHQVCVCVCRSIMASATLINTYPDVRIFFQEYSVVNDALKILVLEN